MKKTIVLLARPGDSTNFMYHYLSQFYTIEAVIFEGKESQKKFIKRRIKRLGFIEVIGQVLFQLFIVKILRIFSKKRLNQIVDGKGLNLNPIPKDRISNVTSINHIDSINLLTTLSPDIAVVNGTRIISKKVLNTFDKTVFLNTHTGITPKYRGVHGGYWSLANNDKENCGVTVHLIDEGIDTGGVLYQKTISVTKKDNFITYPYLQVVEGVELMRKAISDVIENRQKEVYNNLESHLWYHPTLWYYVYHRIFSNIK